MIGIGRNAARAFAPYRTVVHGQRIAIIAATQVLDTNLKAAWTATAHQPGLASAYRERVLIAAVQRARRTSDTVAVYLHWGTETQQCPNTLQPPLARALVRAGSDIVVGAHAHVQLGAGFLGSALVDYGLGNLAFYDTAAPETYSGTVPAPACPRSPRQASRPGAARPPAADAPPAADSRSARPRNRMILETLRCSRPTKPPRSLSGREWPAGTGGSGQPKWGEKGRAEPVGS